jgi:hypothetical protein
MEAKKIEGREVEKIPLSIGCPNNKLSLLGFMEF